MDVKRYYANTTQGPYLNLNEDTCLCDLENQLYMVIDGFGGAGIGDRAANLVKEQLKSFYIKTTEDIDATMPFYFNFHYNLELNALVNALICSHRLLLKDNEEKKISQRAGVSGIFACQSKGILNIISVGSSFCYLLRDEELIRVFAHEHDFSLLNNSREINDPLASKIPYSALGMYYQLDYSVKEVKVQPGDCLLLATDGALDRLDKHQIQRILLNISNDNLMSSLQSLFNSNNSSGNKDNQSAIILEY